MRGRVRVESVEEGSVAAGASISAGDILLTIDGFDRGFAFDIQLINVEQMFRSRARQQKLWGLQSYTVPASESWLRHLAAVSMRLKN